MVISVKQLIVIGDSGVHGWGDRENGGWCEQLKRNWMNLPGGAIVYPLGVRGDGLERVAKRWRNEWMVRGELRRKVPDGVLLSVGLNDTARIGRKDGRPQLSTDAYYFGLCQLLSEIKAETDVMVLGITPVDEGAMPFSGCLWYSNDSIKLYEAQIESACLETDVPFLPVHQYMLKEPDWLTWIEPDGIHLNSEGHSWLLERLANWQPLLSWAELKPIKNVTPTLS
ncbi:GDSL-type esterase/lipase family protein [Prochlorococcus sp. MIT 1300]|uniref:GDSL-type esterase/lipase family protein n=1 Tax=Prochlorococcus sp. MIT 1300 TaxID=3096218 RepID=UPI002A7571EF|nr:GDSL-type esterase/lipase family protein [Prochlorococcus sp. MIT 1300]